MGITCLESEIIISKSEMNNSGEFDSRVPGFIYICHNATKQAYVWMNVIITWTADQENGEKGKLFHFLFHLLDISIPTKDPEKTYGICCYPHTMPFSLLFPRRCPVMKELVSQENW